MRERGRGIAWGEEVKKEGEDIRIKS